MFLPAPTILSEILGDGAVRTGTPHPLNTILSLIDVTGGRCAAMHSQGAVVTGCLDDLSVLEAPCYGEVIVVTAQVVATGKASILTRFTVEKDDGEKRRTCAGGYATFVAVDKDTGGAREVGEKVEGGKLTVEGEVLRGKEILQWMKKQRKVLEGEGTVEVKQVGERDVGRGMVRLGKVVRVRKQFLPANLNMAGKVFGGDLLGLMERVALVCGERVVKRGEVRVVGIRALSFRRPVVLEKVLEVEGKVVVAGGGLLGVVVRTWMEQGEVGEERVLGHSGVFHLVIEVGGVVWKEERELKGGGEEEEPEGGDYWKVLGLPLHERVSVALGVEKGVYPTEAYVAYDGDARMD